jgi:hypothetical protein
MPSLLPLSQKPGAASETYYSSKRDCPLNLPPREPWQGSQCLATRRLQAMTISPHPDEIRTIVFRTFLELDVAEDSLTDLDERIMLDDGRYVARSYRVDDYLAMWMIDVGLVQFYDADGNMLRTVNLFEEIEPQRMAA